MAGVTLSNNGQAESSTIQPLLKWAGGKRWLAGPLAAGLQIYGCDGLVEPFVGGAAFFFKVRPTIAILGDTNADLIACYRAIRDNPDQVSGQLQELMIERATFERIAKSCPRSEVGRAVRLIYLNRTAFGGLWRVNQQGRFNVPFGCKPETRLPGREIIGLVSERLQSTTLYVGDFAEGLRRSQESDIVYCDPPYTVSHNNNGFIRYNERLFGWADQVRLAKAVSALAECGRRVVVSNAAHEEIMALYDRRYFIQVVVSRGSNLAANVSFRGPREEALFLSRALASCAYDIGHTLESYGLHVHQRRGL